MFNGKPPKKTPVTSVAQVVRQKTPPASSAQSLWETYISSIFVSDRTTVKIKTGTIINDRRMSELCVVLKAKNIVSLDLSDVRLTAEPSILAEFLQTRPTLTTLKLSKAKIAPQYLAALAPAFIHLETLDLSGLELRSDFFSTILSAILQEPPAALKLTSLNLLGTTLPENFADFIAATSLSHLSFDITQASASNDLINALHSSGSLRSVNLGSLSDAKLGYLLYKILQNSPLQQLALTVRIADEKQFHKLFESLHSMPNLKKLELVLPGLQFAINDIAPIKALFKQGVKTLTLKSTEFTQNALVGLAHFQRQNPDSLAIKTGHPLLEFVTAIYRQDASNLTQTPAQFMGKQFARSDLLVLKQFFATDNDVNVSSCEELRSLSHLTKNLLTPILKVATTLGHKPGEETAKKISNKVQHICAALEHNSHIELTNLVLSKPATINIKADYIALVLKSLEHHQAIVRISLNGLAITEDIAVNLATIIAGNSGLKSLEFENIRCSNAHFAKLTETVPPHPGLEELAFKNIDTTSFTQAFAKVIGTGQLTTLSCLNCQFDTTTLVAALNSNSNIHRLILDNDSVSKELVARITSRPSPLAIEFSTPPDAKTIYDLIKLQSANPQSVAISWGSMPLLRLIAKIYSPVNITKKLVDLEEELEQLLPLLRKYFVNNNIDTDTPLKTLLDFVSLASAEAADYDFLDLLTALKERQLITELNLNNNPYIVTAAGVNEENLAVLLTALKHHPHITAITLNATTLSKRAASLLAEAITHLPNLTKVNFKDLTIPPSKTPPAYYNQWPSTATTPPATTQLVTSLVKKNLVQLNIEGSNMAAELLDLLGHRPQQALTHLAVEGSEALCRLLNKQYVKLKYLKLDSISYELLNAFSCVPTLETIEVAAVNTNDAAFHWHDRYTQKLPAAFAEIFCHLKEGNLAKVKHFKIASAKNKIKILSLLVTAESVRHKLDFSLEHITLEEIAGIFSPLVFCRQVPEYVKLLKNLGVSTDNPRGLTFENIAKAIITPHPSRKDAGGIDCDTQAFMHLLSALGKEEITVVKIVLPLLLAKLATAYQLASYAIQALKEFAIEIDTPLGENNEQNLLTYLKNCEDQNGIRVTFAKAIAGTTDEQEQKKLYHLLKRLTSIDEVVQYDDHTGTVLHAIIETAVSNSRKYQILKLLKSEEPVLRLNTSSLYHLLHSVERDSDSRDNILNIVRGLEKIDWGKTVKELQEGTDCLREYRVGVRYTNSHEQVPSMLLLQAIHPDSVQKIIPYIVSRVGKFEEVVALLVYIKEEYNIDAYSKLGDDSKTLLKQITPANWHPEHIASSLLSEKNEQNALLYKTKIAVLKHHNYWYTSWESKTASHQRTHLSFVPVILHNLSNLETIHNFLQICLELKVNLPLNMPGAIRTIFSQKSTAKVKIKDVLKDITSFEQVDWQGILEYAASHDRQNHLQHLLLPCLNKDSAQRALPTWSKHINSATDMARVMYYAEENFAMNLDNAAGVGEGQTIAAKRFFPLGVREHVSKYSEFIIANRQYLPHYIKIVAKIVPPTHTPIEYLLSASRTLLDIQDIIVYCYKFHTLPAITEHTIRHVETQLQNERTNWETALADDKNFLSLLLENCATLAESIKILKICYAKEVKHISPGAISTIFKTPGNETAIKLALQTVLLFSDVDLTVVASETVGAAPKLPPLEFAIQLKPNIADKSFIATLVAKTTSIKELIGLFKYVKHEFAITPSSAIGSEGKLLSEYIPASLAMISTKSGSEFTRELFDGDAANLEFSLEILKRTNFDWKKPLKDEKLPLNSVLVACQNLHDISIFLEICVNLSIPAILDLTSLKIIFAKPPSGNNYAIKDIIRYFSKLPRIDWEAVVQLATSPDSSNSLTVTEIYEHVGQEHSEHFFHNLLKGIKSLLGVAKLTHFAFSKYSLTYVEERARAQLNSLAEDNDSLAELCDDIVSNSQNPLIIEHIGVLHRLGLPWNSILKRTHAELWPTILKNCKNLLSVKHILTAVTKHDIPVKLNAAIINSILNLPREEPGLLKEVLKLFNAFPEVDWNYVIQNAENSLSSGEIFECLTPQNIERLLPIFLADTKRYDNSSQNKLVRIITKIFAEINAGLDITIDKFFPQIVDQTNKWPAQKSLYDSIATIFNPEPYIKILQQSSFFTEHSTLGKHLVNASENYDQLLRIFNAAKATELVILIGPSLLRDICSKKNGSSNNIYTIIQYLHENFNLDQVDLFQYVKDREDFSPSEFIKNLDESSSNTTWAAVVRHLKTFEQFKELTALLKTKFKVNVNTKIGDEHLLSFLPPDLLDFGKITEICAENFPEELIEWLYENEQEQKLVAILLARSSQTHLLNNFEFLLTQEWLDLNQPLDAEGNTLPMLLAIHAKNGRNTAVIWQIISDLLQRTNDDLPEINVNQTNKVGERLIDYARESQQASYPSSENRKVLEQAVACLRNNGSVEPKSWFITDNLSLNEEQIESIQNYQAMPKLQLRLHEKYKLTAATIAENIAAMQAAMEQYIRTLVPIDQAQAKIRLVIEQYMDATGIAINSVEHLELEAAVTTIATSKETIINKISAIKRYLSELDRYNWKKASYEFRDHLKSYIHTSWDEETLLSIFQVSLEKYLTVRRTSSESQARIWNELKPIIISMVAEIAKLNELFTTIAPDLQAEFQIYSRMVAENLYQRDIYRYGNRHDEAGGYLYQTEYLLSLNEQVKDNSYGVKILVWSFNIELAYLYRCAQDTKLEKDFFKVFGGLHLCPWGRLVNLYKVLEQGMLYSHLTYTDDKLVQTISTAIQQVICNTPNSKFAASEKSTQIIVAAFLDFASTRDKVGAPIPEQWRSETQLLVAQFNQAFSTRFEQITQKKLTGLIESYHFAGLLQCVITSIVSSPTLYEGPIANQFIEFVNGIAAKLLRAILANPQKADDTIDNFSTDYADTLTLVYISKETRDKFIAGLRNNKVIVYKALKASKIALSSEFREIINSELQPLKNTEFSDAMVLLVAGNNDALKLFINNWGVLDDATLEESKTQIFEAAPAIRLRLISAVNSICKQQTKKARDLLVHEFSILRKTIKAQLVTDLLLQPQIADQLLKEFIETYDLSSLGPIDPSQASQLLNCDNEPFIAILVSKPCQSLLNWLSSIEDGSAHTLLYLLAHNSKYETLAQQLYQANHEAWDEFIHHNITAGHVDPLFGDLII